MRVKIRLSTLRSFVVCLFLANMQAPAQIVKGAYNQIKESWSTFDTNLSMARRALNGEGQIAPDSRFAWAVANLRAASDHFATFSVVSTIPDLKPSRPSSTGMYSLCGTLPLYNQDLNAELTRDRAWLNYSKDFEVQVNDELNQVQEIDNFSDQLRVIMDKVVFLPNGSSFAAEWMTVAVDLPRVIGDLRSNLKKILAIHLQVRARMVNSVKDAERGLTPEGQANYLRIARCPGQPNH